MKMLMVQARSDLKLAAKAARAKKEMLDLSITRIQSWLKRSGKKLTDLFSKIDKDGSGDIDAAEFRAGMLSIGLTFEDSEVEALFEDIDSSGDGCVNVEEFTERMDQFSAALSESAGTILLHLCQHLDREKISLADVFKGVDVDGSGDLTLAEFHEALLSLNIPHKQEGAIAVMQELDMDDDLSITLAELSAHLASYRRGRRAFVAKTFAQCFDFIHRTGNSATQIFSRVDVDGSGELDVLEFQVRERERERVRERDRETERERESAIAHYSARRA